MRRGAPAAPDGRRDRGLRVEDRERQLRSGATLVALHQDVSGTWEEASSAAYRPQESRYDPGRASSPDLGNIRLSSPVMMTFPTAGYEPCILDRFQTTRVHGIRSPIA